MSNELPNLFNELVDEFNSNRIEILNNMRLYSLLRQGSFPNKNVERYSTGGNRINQGYCFNFYSLNQYLRYSIYTFKSCNKIFDYIISNGLSPFDTTIIRNRRTE